MAGQDCPMCGETMRLKEKEVTERLPGIPQTAVAKVREWVCPECDYFEDAENGEGS
jgi:YgiT-type zinc finger domain-containing protein